jgi:putative hydrolase of the HAD superfamily
MPVREVRAVLFDFFNTLTTAVRRGPGHATIARLLGCDPATWIEVMDRTYRTRARGAYGPAIKGLRRVAHEAGGRPGRAELRRAIEARIEVVRGDAPLRPDASATLYRLRDLGLRTAVVSDCWFELPVFLPRLPIAPLLDARVYSVDLGTTKPDPAMYLTACRALGVAPQECVYVGDGGSHELTGAQEAGMTAVRLAAPDLGEHLTFDADLGWRGPVIRSLAHLPFALGRVPVGV